MVGAVALDHRHVELELLLELIFLFRRISRRQIRTLFRLLNESLFGLLEFVPGELELIRHSDLLRLLSSIAVRRHLLRKLLSVLKQTVVHGLTLGVDFWLGSGRLHWILGYIILFYCFEDLGGYNSCTELRIQYLHAVFKIILIRFLYSCWPLGALSDIDFAQSGSF